MTKAGILSFLFLVSLLLSVGVIASCESPAGNPPSPYPAGVPADVGKQIVKLQSKHPYTRVRAADALGDMGYRAAPAVPYLIQAMADTEIGKSIGDKMFGFLFLGGGGSGISTAAMNSLVRIGSPSVEPLIGALRHQNSRIRNHAASALGSLALQGIKSPNEVSPLIEALHDEDSLTRNFVARTLGDIGDQLAVEPLIHALRDEDMGVRGDAAGALGKLKDRRAVGPLIEMLTERKQNYQFAAEALQKITGRNFGDDCRKWRDWWSENGRGK